MASTTSHTGKSGMTIDLTGCAAHTGGDIANVLNPEGEDLIITSCVLYSTHASTGAANLNAGIGTDKEHDQTELFNALDAVAAAAGNAYNGYASAAAKGALVVWPAAQYLLVNASADTSGFTGRIHVKYVHA